MKHLHHIVPKHMGGTDDPSNIVELSVKDHAEEHRILFEKFGREEDRIAWQGLSGIIGKEDIIKQVLSFAAKKGNSLRVGDKHPFYGKKRPQHSLIMSSKNFGKFKSAQHQAKLNSRFTSDYIEKVSNSIARDWIVSKPDGTVETIHNMDKFCKENGLNKGCMSAVSKGKQKTHKGYFCRKVS